jgi:hypothetical protein
MILTIKDPNASTRISIAYEPTDADQPGKTRQNYVQLEIQQVGCIFQDSLPFYVQIVPKGEYSPSKPPIVATREFEGTHDEVKRGLCCGIALDKKNNSSEYQTASPKWKSHIRWTPPIRRRALLQLKSLRCHRCVS